MKPMRITKSPRFFAILFLLVTFASTANAQFSFNTLTLGTGSNILTLTSGGNGTLTLPASGTLLTTNSTITASNIADDGSTGKVLTSNGGTPIWSTSSATAAQYLYMYSTDPQIVFSGFNVEFLESGPISGPTDGTIGALISESGVYRVDYSVYPLGSSTFALLLNGVAVPGATISCAAYVLTQQSVLVSCNSGDELALVNVGGGSVILSVPTPGSLDASLMITLVH